MAQKDQFQDQRIPVTILTGFLGSGKTTLLNHILTANHGKKLAIIENEFGQIGIDENILQNTHKETSEETIIEVKNGCICCTVRGDLVESLKKIWTKAQDGRGIDGIIIETTGLADPAPICQTFFVEEEIAPKYVLDSVITVVDAMHILQHVREEKPEGVENESIEQLAFADKVFLNKTDLVKEEPKLQEIEKEIKKINKWADITRTAFKDKAPPMSEILDLKKFDLTRVQGFDPEFLEDQEHEHDQTVGSEGFKLDHDQPLNLFKLNQWINHLLKTYSEDLFRYKGVINVQGRDEKFIFQGVHMLFGGDFALKWGKDEKRVSYFCFIGKNLKKMNLWKGFEACVGTPLRFKVGSRVKANVSSGFEPGVVVKVWDEGNPYRVKLDKGIEVWAPDDIDNFIQAE